MKLEVKIPLDKAAEEIEAWFDRKKIMPSQRETYKDHTEILVEALAYGILALDDQGCFTQQIQHTSEDEAAVSVLKYKSRVSARVVEPHLKGVKGSDSDGRILAYMACLTDQPKGVLKALDSSDSRIANSIVVFFLG
ncbi:MAG: hypothetical protein H7282_04975 [Cytophagaceae bacterium]|nr:hypothetical protein [Cytophagaceae bacterium]